MNPPTPSKGKYIRSDINVKGKVQVVGFRDTVKDTAICNKVYGEVRNLSNYDVSIICEGTKKNVLAFEKTLENLRKNSKDKKKSIAKLSTNLKKIQSEIKKIQKRKSDNDILKLLELEKLKLKLEKELRLQKLPEPEITSIGKKHTKITKLTFSGFRIIRDIDEQGERLDFGAQQLVGLQKETIDNINFSLMDMNFERLDLKYGVISKNLNKLIEAQDQFIQSMKEDRREMREMVSNINALVSIAIKTSSK